MPKWQDRPSKAQMDTYAALARPSATEMGHLSLNCVVGDMIQVGTDMRIWLRGIVGDEVLLRVTIDGEHENFSLGRGKKLPLSEAIDATITKLAALKVTVAFRAPRVVRIDRIAMGK